MVSFRSEVEMSKRTFLGAVGCALTLIATPMACGGTNGNGVSGPNAGSGGVVGSGGSNKGGSANAGTGAGIAC